ncbi:TPA: hypothetical protein KEU23_001384 [Klebsiella oxytoca]|nr:hypothetical protein [Klebsiella oxytoca]HEC2091880.1 hypothetical protein [Klebsiella oxytoca]
MTDITELAQRTDLLMDNALETAKQLRELSESTVADAIFESIVENENGKEIQFERPISDLAYAAFLKLERLVEALEKAQQAINEMDDRIRKQNRHVCELFDDGKALRERIAELESRTVKLPKRSVGEVMHMSGFSRDYAEGWCAGNDNAIHEIHNSGIKVEG